MSEAAWKREFSGAAYLAMRKSDPTLVAAVTTKSIGRWKKDWSEIFKSTSTSTSPGLNLSSIAPKDFDGVPCVETGLSHRIAISKASDKDKVAAFRVLLSAPVPASNYSFSLGGGLAEIAVGPSPHPCDVFVTVADVSGMAKSSSIKIRFK